MRHFMSLTAIPFEMIKSGQKTIELRLNDEKRKLIHAKDEIEFLNVDDTSQSLLVSVVKIWRFDSFSDLYNSLPLLRCGYTEVDVKTATANDMDIYYSKEKQKQFGVLGIEVKVM